MKNIFKLALMAFLVLTVSCEQNADSDPMPENLSSVDAKGKKYRPISISIVTDAPFQGVSSFTGKMTHLGNISGSVGTGVLDLSTGVFTSCPDVDVIIAANGDELWSQVTFQFIPTDAASGSYYGTVNFIGGTGRFENASGFMYVGDGEYTDDTDFICGDNVSPSSGLTATGKGLGSYSIDLNTGDGVYAHEGSGYIKY